MVVKEHLESQGVDLERFQALHHSKRNPRRQLIRMAGGEITVPVQRTNKDIKEKRFVPNSNTTTTNSQ